MSFKGTSRFQVIRLMGKGGMGTVVEAFDRERQVPVALKLLTQRESEALLRFKREFRALQHVHHPNLVSLGELFEHEGLWFFSMELVRGVDILSYVRGDAARTASRRDPTPTLPSRDTGQMPAVERIAFDEARLRAAFHQLGVGLAALHRQGHIHRDVKPSNVLVTPENRVVLLDFGLIRADTAASAESSPNVVYGTPEYMAPEQAAGAELTPASDWYAVGALLYEALTGTPPFVGKPLDIMVRKQAVDPPSPMARVPDTPGDLDALCMALLRRNAAQRPSEAETLGRLYVELRRDDATYLALPVSPKSEQFVARELELATLNEWLDEAAGGRIVDGFVTGPWGIGKTALLRTLTQSLREDPRQPIVLSGRCYERETIPFKAVDMLVDDIGRLLVRAPKELVTTLLPPDMDLVARTFPVFDKVEPVQRLPLRSFKNVPPETLRSRLQTAIRALFHAVARLRPLVLLIEDLQWAQADGLQALREILAGPSDAPILLVGTTRTDEPLLFAPSLLLEGLPRAAIRTLHIDRLPQADGEALVHALAPDADDRLAYRIAREGVGHPVFIRELCLSRAQQARDLDQALHARIKALPLDTRTVLEVIAVAVTPLPQATVAEASGLGWPEVERAISLLRAALLVRTVGLRRTDLVEMAHDRVREAVVDHVLAPQLKQLHHRIAEALEQWPRATPQPIADHWLAAGEPRRALQRLLDGAARAVEALAFDQAQSLYQRALALSAPEERAEIERRADDAARLAAQR